MAKSSAELAAQYGFSEAFFRSDPELWTLYQKARKGKWTPTKFQGEFMNTTWFRTRQASIRQWADLTTRDPAEAQAKIAERSADLSDRFSQLGITVDAGTLTNLATESLRWAWSDNQLANVLADYVHYVPGGTSGTVAALETRIKDMAYQFGVTVTDDQMGSWLTNLVNKSWTEDNISDILRDAAKSKYVALQPQLDAGRTTRDIASQHLAEYARLMEVDGANISLDDPIIAKALQGSIDPKTGVPVGQTVFQMSQDIRRDKRWLQTKNARDSMMDATMGVLKDMGLV